MSNKAIDKAVELLARREHSRRELFVKLTTRGFNEAEIESALNEAKQKGWQSDERFVESFIHSLQLKGQGPVKIAYALCEKGIDESLVNQFINEHDQVWHDLLAEVRIKKFGTDMPLDYEQSVPQKKFLLNRGFNLEKINRLFAQR